jgi:Sigma-54 interaction domain
VCAIEAVMSATVLATNFISVREPRSAIRLVGTSKAWCHVLERATRVAATDVTTCLQGESGTGKEVIARFIHASSPRKHGPFIAINCAALPDQLRITGRATPVSSATFLSARLSSATAHSSRRMIFHLTQRRRSASVTRLS